MDFLYLLVCSLIIMRIILFLLLMVIPLSCAKKEGTLIVKTYPVKGKIIIDKADPAESPVTVSLPAGTHIVSFGEYSDQYEPPVSREITIEHEREKIIKAVYRNRFIPDELPDGFTEADPLCVYGTEKHPQKDGTIFDYINGGGLVYLKYGLKETTHAVYHSNNGDALTIDIFDMGTTEHAMNAMDDEEICPEGFIPDEIGEECKKYHYEPDFLMYFRKSSYLAYISTNNDSLRNSVESFAYKIENNIP